ncbi:MAG: preprotein translocase subunit SecG [Bacteroidota bacterium]
MTVIFLVLIIIAAIALAFLILVQNPKGGGLQGNVGGFGNQFMGVKQTTDVLEKGTWIFAAVIGVLCLISTLFFSSGTSKSNLDRNFSAPPAKSAPAPASTTPATQPAANPDTATAQKP